MASYIGGGDGLRSGWPCGRSSTRLASTSRLDSLALMVRRWDCRLESWVCCSAVRGTAPPPPPPMPGRAADNASVGEVAAPAPPMPRAAANAESADGGALPPFALVALPAEAVPAAAASGFFKPPSAPPSRAQRDLRLVGGGCPSADDEAPPLAARSASVGASAEVAHRDRLLRGFVWSEESLPSFFSSAAAAVDAAAAAASGDADSPLLSTPPTSPPPP